MRGEDLCEVAVRGGVATKLWVCPVAVVWPVREMLVVILMHRPRDGRVSGTRRY